MHQNSKGLDIQTHVFMLLLKCYIFTQFSLYSSFVLISVLLKSSVMKVDQGIQASTLSRMKNTEYSRVKMVWWNLNSHISPERDGTLRNDISLRLWRFCFNTRMYVKVMFASMVLPPVDVCWGEKMPLQLEVADPGSFIEMYNDVKQIEGCICKWSPFV